MRLSKIVLGCLLSIVSFGALGQNFPSKPIRVIVPYGAGTGLDVIVRLIAKPLGENLGQPVVTENRPGAGGSIGTAAVATAVPDGHTVVAVPSSHTTVSLLLKGIPYDPAGDFAGITTLAENPLVMVIARSKGIQTVRELVAAAKSKPGSVSFASAGSGTSTHIAAEKFRIAGGFQALHVPYKSTTLALTEVMAGRIDFVYTSLVAALPGIQAETLVPLAMSSKRSSVLPKVPTIEETGMSSSAYSSWLGVLAPSKTPRTIVNRLNAETIKVLSTADIKDRFAKIGTEPMTMSPAEFDKLIRSDLAANKRIIKAVGIKTD